MFFLVTGVFGMLSAGVLSATIGYFTYSPIERENNIREKWYLLTQIHTNSRAHAHAAESHSRSHTGSYPIDFFLLYLAS